MLVYCPFGSKVHAFVRDIDKLSAAEGLCRLLEQFTFNLTLTDLFTTPPTPATSASPSLKSGRKPSVTQVSLDSHRAPKLAGNWDEVAAVDAPNVIHVSSSPKLHKKTFVGVMTAASKSSRKENRLHSSMASKTSAPIP